MPETKLVLQVFVPAKNPDKAGKWFDLVIEKPQGCTQREFVEIAKTFNALMRKPDNQ